MSHPKRSTDIRRRVRRGPCLPVPEFRADAPGNRQEQELDAKLDQLMRLRQAQVPTSPILERLFAPTTSTREARRLLDKIRRWIRRSQPPAKNRGGRPKGPSLKLDDVGAKLFVLVDVMGAKPAIALRATGLDAESYHSDWNLLRSRLKTWRYWWARLTPEHRHALTVKVLSLIDVRSYFEVHQDSEGALVLRAKKPASKTPTPLK